MFGRILIALSPIMLAVAAPVGAEGITYDCDTAAGHFSLLSLPTGETFHASGKIRLSQMYKSKSFASTAKLRLTTLPEEPGPSRGPSVGFSFMNLADQKEPVPGLLSIERTRTDSDVIGVASGDEVSFEMSYDGEALHINVDGHNSVLPFSSEQPALEITCSTGEFLITDLVISG